MRKPVLSGFLMMAGGLLLQACGDSTQSSAPAQRPLPVSAITAQYEPVPAAVEAPATVQPRSRIVLSAQISGFVRNVNVRAGEMVSAGQLLVSLDARDADSQKAAAQAAIDEAQAALNEARKGAQAAAGMRAAAKANHDLASATYQRYEKLFEARSVSVQEIDEVRTRRDAAAGDLTAREMMAAAADERLKEVSARIEQAQAQARRAEVVVGWTTIKAPAAGRVVERSVDPGTIVFPGTQLLVIESAANPQVLAEIPTANLAILRLGQEVTVRLSDSSAPLKGRVTEIVPLSNPATHTAQFKVDLAARSSATPGSFARVDIPSGSRNVMLLPRQAVRESGQLAGVFIVDGASRARYRLAKITGYDADRVEVLSGIQQGEKVVRAVSEELVDGAALEVRQ